MDELLSIFLGAAVINWPKLGLPVLPTLVLVKSWSCGEMLGKIILHLSQDRWKKDVSLTGCIRCLSGCLGYMVLPAPLVQQDFVQTLQLALPMV